MKSQNDLSPKGENTRDRVLSFARDMLVDQGYDALVLRRIAEALDMKLSNVQYYFKTKDDLVAAIIESEELYDIEVLREALDRFEDGRDIVRYVLSKLLEHWRGSSGAIFRAREFFAWYKPAIHLTKKENDDLFFSLIERLVERLNPKLSKGEIKARRRLVVVVMDGGALSTDMGQRNKFTQALEDLIISIATAD